MTYSFRPAVRENISLLIALAAPTGGGKTFTALRLATGLAQGGKIAFIDTETGRGLHYADKFKFNHCNLSAPFRPDAYLEAIEDADKAGHNVIIIDSTSHEWSGVGGVLDWHEEEVDIAVKKAKSFAESKGWNFDEHKAREANKMTAWIKPKMSHKQMISRLLQVKAHIIFCLRAEEKTLMTSTTDEHGKKKTVIVPAADRPINERWQPICEKNFMFEQTMSFVLLPNAPGVGVPIKLSDDFKAMIPAGQQLNESVGEKLAQWAKGTNTKAVASATTESFNWSDWGKSFVADLKKCTTLEELETLKQTNSAKILELAALAKTDASKSKAFADLEGKISKTTKNLTPVEKLENK